MPNQPDITSSKTPYTSREKISLILQLILSFAIAGGVFVFLLFYGGTAEEDEGKRPARPEATVTIAGPRTLAIKSGTPLDTKLDNNAKVRLASLTTPILPVTGTVLVSLQTDTRAVVLQALEVVGAPPLPGLGAMLSSLRSGGDTDTWQFATGDLLSAFADWQKAVSEVRFQRNQLDLIAEMNNKRVKRQEEVVARKRELVDIGTETKEVLAAEETNLIQFEIQKRKEIHEQETQVRLAERTEATLARQLQQNGLEPKMLRSTAIEGVIVVADVPERTIRLVKVGMHCSVEFFALPDHKPFTGKVSSIAPVISKEKRVASVQFVVADPEKEIRPGMFARIGLGDKREALVMPADGVIHIGDRDYVLVGGKDDRWQIFQVETGELLKNPFDLIPGDLVKSEIEILSGYSLENPVRKLQRDDRVIGQGAILLQPMVIRALQTPIK